MIESGLFSISTRLLIYGLSCQMIFCIGNPHFGAVFNGDPISPPATTSCEPRQARKGAAAAVASGAGVRRVRVATLSKN